MKLIPKSESKGVKHYDAIVAFDTRAKYEVTDEYDECPVSQISIVTIWILPYVVMNSI